MKLRVVFSVLFSFSFLLSFSQVANQPGNIEFCDDTTDGDDTNGFYQNFILNVQDAVILGAQSPSDFTVTYHESQSDANSGTNQLNSSNPYSNTVANSQIIFARVTDNNTSSFATTSFELAVNPLPNVNAVVELHQCDDDTDGITSFNLTDANSEISTNFMNEVFEFYESESNALNGINSIIDPTNYTNLTPSNQTIWARTIDSSTGCSRVSQLDLTASTTQIPSSFQRTFNVCDDFLDINGDNNANNDDSDGISSFDFSSVTVEVQLLFTPGQQLSISYYRNLSDALNEINPINDPSNYRNIDSPNTQNIYVRVNSQSDDSCLGIGHHVTLNVDNIPVSNLIADIEINDNANDGSNTNGLVQNINLEAQTLNILGSQNPSEFSVTYHTTFSNAASGVNPLMSPFSNSVPFQQTIYVRVEHLTTGCVDYQNTFDVIVNTTLGVGDDSLLNVSLYPNPVDREITLEISDGIHQEVEINLFNLLGELIQREVKSPIQNKLKMDISPISNGMYILKVVSEEKSTVKKFIVNHK